MSLLASVLPRDPSPDPEHGTWHARPARLEDAGDASVFLQQDFHLRKDGLAAHAVTIEISLSSYFMVLRSPF